MDGRAVPPTGPLAGAWIHLHQITTGGWHTTDPSTGGGIGEGEWQRRDAA
jgi:hypothetical protein